MHGCEGELPDRHSHYLDSPKYGDAQGSETRPHYQAHLTNRWLNVPLTKYSFLNVPVTQWQTAECYERNDSRLNVSVAKWQSLLTSDLLSKFHPMPSLPIRTRSGGLLHLLGSAVNLSLGHTSQSVVRCQKYVWRSWQYHYQICQNCHQIYTDTSICCHIW